MVKVFVAALALSTALALEPITIRGNAFYNGNDSRFFIRGADYQPGGSSNLTDPLANPETCKRDIAKFKDLGLNTIRVYTIDNSANHDECMAALDEAGIYLLLDVNTPKNSLNPLNNETLQVSYNTGYLQHIFATIDAFKDYNNTLGFFSANEVINSYNTTIGAPYVKAVTRDMKKYIKAQSKRIIPVGYSAADIIESRWEQMCYFNCGDDEDSRIDMFGVNDYSWCGDMSSFTVSGWSANVKKYSNYSIPMFLSEYGCNINLPRTFPEVKSLYSTEMSSVYSGGLVYEYSNAVNNFGLVDIQEGSVTEREDYPYFKKALAGAPNPTGDAGASTSRSIAQCPNFEAGTWNVSPDQPLPVMPKNAEVYMKQGAGKPLGMNGSGTQSGSDLDKDDNSGNSKGSSSGKSSSAGRSRGSGSATSNSGSKKDTSASGSPKRKSKNVAGGQLTASNAGILGLLLSLAAYI